MKIGILTSHRVHNYGAVLQAYALLCFLKKEGCDVKIIDYWPPYRKGMYGLVNLNFKQESSFHTLYRILVRIIKFPISALRFSEKFIRHKRFEKFIREFLGISGTLQFSSGEEIIDDCDLYIVGSDQIWRYYEFPNQVGFDPVYWGNFLHNSESKKIAYAASMGSIVAQSHRIDHIRENIRNFRAVSVRESHLKDFLQSCTSIEAEHVLDPAFLLDRDEWSCLVNPELDKKMQKKKYVLCYNLTMDGDFQIITNIIAHKFNLEIIEIQGGVNPLDFTKNHYQSTGPREFLTLIKNAQFVVASSFHGVVFSIIFGKSFYAVGMENSTDRVVSLLSLLGIDDRFIKNLFHFSPEHINQYDSIYQNLDLFLKKSKDFLQSQIH